MKDAPIYDDDFRPSATLEEAVERLGATCKRRIAELEKQRDSLAICLREVKDGFSAGRFVVPFVFGGKSIAEFTRLMQRIDAALAAVPRKEAP